MADVLSAPRRDPDVFDFHATLRGLSATARLHWRLIAVTCALTLLFTTVYVLVWPPIYRAEAMIMGERDLDASRDGFYGGWNIFRKDDQRSELELMVSGPVLIEVVRRVKLTYADVYHPIGSQLRYFWDVSWPGRAYQAIKEKFVTPDPDAPTKEETEFAKTVIDLKSGVSVEPVGEAFIGRMVVKGPSPLVAKIANTMLDVYQEQRTARYESEAKRAVDSLDEELEIANRELRKAEQARLRFAKENGVMFDFQKEAFDVKALSDMEQSIATSRMRVASLEGYLAELERQLGTEPAMKTSATLFELNGVRENLKAKRVELQTSLILTQSRYRDDSPEVEEIRRNIREIDALIASASEKVEKTSTETVNPVRQQLLSSYSSTRIDLAAARAGLKVMERTAARESAHLARMPSLQTTMKSLERDVNLALAKANELMNKRTQAAVSLASTKAAVPSIRVVEYAGRPSSKYWPRIVILYPVALLIGLVLGLTAAQLARLAGGKVRRENWGRRTHDAAIYGDVTFLTNAPPILGVVRVPRSASGKPSREASPG